MVIEPRILYETCVGTAPGPLHSGVDQKTDKRLTAGKRAENTKREQLNRGLLLQQRPHLSREGPTVSRSRQRLFHHGNGNIEHVAGAWASSSKIIDRAVHVTCTVHWQMKNTGR